MLENIESKNNGVENNPIPLFRSSSDNIHAQKSFEAACHKQLTSANNKEEFTIRISGILEKMGFTTFTFSSLTNSPRFIISTLPEALIQSYRKGYFINSDYAVHYGLSGQSSMPIFRSTIENYMTAAPMETLDMARNRKLSNLFKCHGYYDDYLIPLSSGQCCYLFSVTTQASAMESFYQNITNHEQQLTLLANLILHLGLLKYNELFQEAEPPKDINLQSKPVELLRTIAQDDFTLDQTADRLCISLHTADKHSATIRKALGAKTLAGAIYKAVKRGVID